MEVGDILNILDLACEVLPWISNQVILLGQQTRNNAYGTLGCELFVLSQQLPNLNATEIAGEKLLKLFELVDKACSRSRQGDRFQVLYRIRSYKDSIGSPRQILIKEIQESLAHFVLNNPEYHVLLRLIPDCLTLDEKEHAYLEDDYLDEDDVGYPADVNDALYAQLEAYHATCRCDTGHLEWTRLRLNTDSQKTDEDVSFEFVLEANSPKSMLSTKPQSFISWKELIVLVSSDVMPTRKKVGFTTPSIHSIPPRRNSSRSVRRMRRIEEGEFCRLINNRLGNPVDLSIQANVLKLVEPPSYKSCRGILPVPGRPLGQWLQQTLHLSNKGKSHLAYTIARSVWQYYSSPWMKAPWTHQCIQLLHEGNSLASQGKPHPYLTTKLIRAVEISTDVYSGDDLMHQFPNILALGILLIEIALKQPLKIEQLSGSLSEAVVNDYYTWAWTTANANNLKDTLHPMYEEAVSNCLNSELFGGYAMPSSQTEDIRCRQQILYEKIVLPLKRLSDAYKDDWEIQAVSSSYTTTISPPVIPTNSFTISGSSRDDFTIAIFCALPLEGDAVSALFDELCEDATCYQNAPGDSNTYTLGRMGRHQAVLVHLPGMGKSIASQAASAIRSTYPNIKLALVVGICGGVPYKKGGEEIILGDVVVSDGIIQHDFGRRVPGAFLRKTSVADSLSRPNVAIRGFLAKIKTTMARNRISSNIARNLEVISQELGDDTAAYPGIEQDELFHSTYLHKHHDPNACSRCTDSIDETCGEVFDLTCQQLNCHKDHLVQRTQLATALALNQIPTPTVHIGLIASGDTVMKSGQDRDLIATQDNIIAFEMEGAGVWDSLPCLVVKGVCDYADSHKNKVWQRYAAATGAACMKALLDEWGF